MQQLTVVKIGGNIVDDESALSAFLHTFAQVDGHKILVHGGGKMATRLAETMGVKQQMEDGRRITDAETLRIVTMVYAGLINKNIVAQLQQHACNPIGLSGADGNAILAHKRVKLSETGESIDYGFAGDIDTVNAPFIKSLLDQQLTPVIAPITHDGKGQLLNTNADTIAQEMATAMSSLYDTTLIYSFEKPGVLLDTNDDNSVISVIRPGYYRELKMNKLIFAGMIPKLDNAFSAMNKGVSKVIIGKANHLNELLQGSSGTTILNE